MLLEKFKFLIDFFTSLLMLHLKNTWWQKQVEFTNKEN